MMSKTEHILGKPVVFKRAKKKKKKGKKSASLRDAHTTERHLRRAARRTARAMERGTAVYAKASKKAARKKKDGAIVSFLPNVVKGGTAVLQDMTVVPFDLLRAGYTKQTRRLTRRAVRAAAKTTDKLLP
ncbi:MAG: hypothetical protein ACE5FD_13240 [Anaerolineae bacterium]